MSAAGGSARWMLLASVLAGCMYVRPALQPGPWDLYGNSGPLKVYGAPRSAPGPRIVRALRDEPAIRDLLERQGEPDTVEVVGDRLDPKRLVLTYHRPDVGRPRRIVLVPTNGGYVARAPELLRSPRAVARRDESRATAAATVAAPPDADGARAPAVAEVPAAAPTAVQRLECPIDRDRADCRAFCVAGATWDWCR